MPAKRAPVPVYAARLPRAEALRPYLERVDAAGIYSNRGPLVRELEERLHATLGLGAASIVTAASGTAALQAAILATAGRATASRPLALVPAYTFVATAHAVMACGYAPVFADPDPSTWALDPGGLSDRSDLGRIGLVVPVACYGRAPDQAAWRAWRDRAGIPVVIDAASAFEAIRRDPAGSIGHVPVVLSFHATKLFSTGEGGAVMGTESDLFDRVTRACNFGLSAERSVLAPGLNGKLSEYHAAVGLAALDGLAATEAERAERFARIAAEAARHGVDDALVRWPTIASTYAIWTAPNRDAATRACASLEAAGIGWRRWYGDGLHREPGFADAARVALPIADDLAARLIGVPCYAAISSEAVARCVAILAG